MANYLSFKEICSLLPDKYIPKRKIGANKYLTENNTKICITCSKLYKEKNIYWYCIFFNNLVDEGIEYICFCTAKTGIIFVPIKVLNEYISHANVKTYSNGSRYYIRIKDDDGKIILYQSGQQNIDVTSYFRFSSV